MNIRAWFQQRLSRERVTAFIVALALFMDALDTTIINTAIPEMAKHLAVQPVDLKIALISYLVSLSIFIPISGWLVDKYGIKHVFVTALSIFTLSSIWCGTASNLLELTIARACQGVGGSLILPLGRLIILHTFKRHELVKVMNGVVMVVSLGLMLGPLAGGIITDYLSWHWIFWVNVPVGLLATIIAYKVLQESPLKQVPPFDYLGFILFGGGLAILTFSLAYLSESLMNSSIAFSMMLVSIGMLVSYFWRAYYRSKSFIRLSLFRNRTFRVSILGNLFSRFGFGGVPFLLPLLFQIALGFRAETSGLLLVPIAFGVITVKSISFYMLKLFGYKRLLLLNTGFVTLSLLAFQFINAETSYYFIALLTFAFGFFISLHSSAMNSIAYAQISQDDLSAAASIVSTSQQLSQSFGVAIAALFLEYYAPLIALNLELSVAVFHKTFLSLGVLTAISTVIFLELKTNDGIEMLEATKEETSPSSLEKSP